MVISNIDLSALNGSSGFKISGEAADDYSGRSVSGAGDVNGDGFDDLIIGAYSADPNGTDSGAAYVVFGNAAGFTSNLDLVALDGTDGFKLSGEASRDYAGMSVSGAGDVNGDGFDDIIIGAFHAYGSDIYSGESYVVFGKATGFTSNLDLSSLDGTNGFELTGAMSDFSGYSVSGVGDVNGDGFDDIIIGSVGDSSHGYYTGASYVVFGKATGFSSSLNFAALDGTNGFKLSGVAAYDQAGFSVSNAGDVNGDGFADIIVGAYGSDTHGYSSGVSYVVFGKASGFNANLDLSTLNGTNGFRLYGVTSRDYSGSSVSSAGDVNGDGFDDLIIGAQGAGQGGVSYVIFGKATGYTSNLELSTLNGVNGFKVSGESADDVSGRSVSGAGDVNGDGFDDLIIGAWAADPNGDFSGASYVVFGKAAGFTANINLSSLNGTNGFQISGAAAEDLSGRSVSSAGDINGDGYDDLIIGAYGAEGNGLKSGASYVVYGQDFNNKVTHQGTTSNDNLTGTASANVMVGGLGNDTLIGAAGNDALSGGAGDDSLDGGTGIDILTGGSGNDIYVVDNVKDLIKEDGPSDTDLIKTTLSAYSLIKQGNIENLTYIGTAVKFTGTGNALNNIITGGAAGDILNGGAGNDTLDGGLGNDTLIGGTGNDNLNGGEGSDLYLVSASGDKITGEITDAGLIGTDEVRFTATAASTFTVDANDTGLERVVIGTGSAAAAVTTGVAAINVDASAVANALSITGNAGANSITGGDYADTLIGGTGNDSLDGGTGNDSLDGGTGNDSMTGGIGDDTYIVNSALDIITENATEGTDSIKTSLVSFDLSNSTTNGNSNGNIENLTYIGTAVKFTGTGNSNNNSITGGAAGDILNGGAGNDTLNGGAGADTLIGGTGDDTYVIDNIGDKITEAASADIDTVQTKLTSYNLSSLTTNGNSNGNIENLTYIGTAVKFTGTGNALNNIITGGAAGDILNGGAGNDTLDGGLGNDTLIGGTGNDNLNGGEGSDLYLVSASGDKITGEITDAGLIGTDEVRFTATAASTFTVDANDTGLERVVIGTGSAAAAVTTGVAAINVDASAVANALSITGNAGANSITGGDYADTLIGGTGNDSLDGGTGNDSLDGGTGNDSMTGGIGDDTYIVNSALDIITENATEGTDSIKTSLVSFDLSNSTTNGNSNGNIENLTYIGTAVKFTGTGNSNNNSITGGAAGDILNGGAGNDTLNGGAGADTLIGGTGDDTYVIDNIGDKITEAASADIDTVQTKLTSYNLSSLTTNGNSNGNIENLTYIGTAVKFTGTGNALNNIITGGAAGDILNGGAGNDTLDGGLGNDTLIGGTGDDTYVIDNAGDRITEASGAGIDTVQTSLTSFDLSSSTTNGNSNLNIESLTYTGAAVNFTGTGNALDNIITGGAADDNLTGGIGNDTLDGGAGADTLIGGAGDDAYIVDSSSDVVTEAASEGNDTVHTNLTSYTLSSNVENLTYIGTGNFTGTGNALNNVLTGGIGNDTLDGGAGADTLIGGAGDDAYIVDSSSDVVTEAASEGNDTVHTNLTSYTLSSNVENLTYIGTGNFTGTGNALNNVLTGGIGNDTLDGGAGADTLIGGTGNDTYDFNIVDKIIEIANEGTDTLLISGTGQTLDLSAATVSQISNIDIIDITGSGNNTLTLNATAIDTIADSSNTLTIKGNAGDALNLTDTGWSLTGTTNISSQDYFQYTKGVITLNVDTDITQDIVPVSNVNLSSLSGNNGFKLSGEMMNDGAGNSVSSAGDVNGDGFDDVIIGASGAAPHGFSSGASYVVFGKTTGFNANLNLENLDGANGFKLSGVSAANFSGTSVNNAGDVNGDGFSDLIIGASWADPHGSKSGASYVAFGKVSGFSANLDLSALDGINGFKLSGVAVDDEAGGSVSGAGDVNGDGFDDLVIGAYNADPNGAQSGASYVVFGHASGFSANLDLSTLDGSNGFKLSGVAAGDSMGRSVSNAGDVNGDGFDDLLIGADSATPNGVSFSGASYVVFGHASGFSANLDLSTLDGSNGFKLSGVAAGDSMGRSVSNAGDVNGDGFDDLIIGALFADSNGADSGASYVVFGHASGFSANLDLSTLDGSNGFKLSGAAADDLSGWSVSNAGDVNGDGFDDLVIGALQADSNGLGNSGASYVVFGHASGFSANLDLSTLDGSNGFKLSGVAAGDRSGKEVSGAGDVNGDGFDDLIIGAPAADSNNIGFSGAGYVVFGKDFGHQFTHLGTTSNDTLTGTANADNMAGGLGNDSLSAAGGNDILFGGAGNDTLDGGLGNDVLRGGDDADTFVFDAALDDSTNLDTISDFVSGSDSIELDQAIFTALGIGNLSATNFHADAGGPSGLDADDFIYYDTSAGSLYYDADGSGSIAAIKFAALSGAPVVAETDFTVVT